MKKVNQKQLLLAYVTVFGLMLISDQAMAQSAWTGKLQSTLDQGASSINSLLDTFIKFLMAISALIFLVGIGNAAFKYFQGDREAFKSISNIFYGMLVLFLGSALIKLLYF